MICLSFEDNYLKAVGRVLSGDGPVDKHKAAQAELRLVFGEQQIFPLQRETRHRWVSLKRGGMMSVS